jgi:type VI secretion system VgrG family protein
MTQANFKFVSDAIGGDQFTVVSFTGREAVSELYRYEIEVKAPLSADIDLDDVLDGLVHFVTEQNGVEFPVNGILSSFEEFKTVQNYAHYKAILVPSIWKLSNYKTNEIFYQAGEEGDIDAGLTITDIITQVLEKSGMSSDNFDLGGLSSKLLKREYTCQYGESDFDFMSRLLENEGVFYYFEQSATEEKIVFVNDMNYLSLPRPRLIFDVAAMASNQDDGVFGWSCRKQRLAERVVVRNYNPEEPSLDVSDTTVIDSMGQGTEYIYGQNVQTDTEATYLSQIRAEEQICRKTQFFGESSVTRLQAGYLFLLEQHPNTKYNAIEYLAIEVNHEGHNLDMSIAHDANKKTRPQYQNSFVAISADVQYRPPLKTIKPRITGNLHARIDGELLSEYAQLDSEGRYKVSMPFDFHNDDHPEGLASARVRMMQPYAGKGRGMQFPMAKGTEVLLTFVNGDPDRPLIAGAINTAAAPGPVNADNQTESVIQTGGNNKIRMEDEEGKERVVLSTPLSNSWIRMGAHNDPIILQGNATENVVLGVAYAEPNPAATTTRDEQHIDLSPVESVPPFDKDTPGTYRFTYTSEMSKSGHTETAIRTVNVLLPSDNAQHEIADQDGIRIRSGSSLWLESGSRYGNYKSGVPSSTDVRRFPYEADTDTKPAQVANMLENFGDGYNPTNLRNSKTGAVAGNGPSPTGTTVDAMVGQDVTVSSLDTFTTQEGNIYDFGGYWNYNLGNSYAENHMKQGSSVRLNSAHSKDLTALAGPMPGKITASKIGNLDDNTWIEKTYGGASYDYTKETKMLSTEYKTVEESHVYGKETHEYVYRGDDSKMSYAYSGAEGVKEEKWNASGNTTYLYSKKSGAEDEKKYDSKSGALYNHSVSAGTGIGMAKFDFDYSNTVSMTVNTGSLISIDSFLGGKIEIENSVGACISLSMALGMVMELNSSFMKMEIGNDGIKSTLPGLKIAAKATEMETNAARIATIATVLENSGPKIGLSAMDIECIGTVKLTA